jgi:hypothetical protein
MQRGAFCAFLLFGLLGAIVVRADDDTVASRVIPFDSMAATNAMLVHGVTDHYTLRREYPAEEFKARIVLFEYLVDHMDACSALAQQAGLITYRASSDADGHSHAEDHAGAGGYLLNVYAGVGKRIIYVEGTQHGLFDVHGRGVAVVDYHAKAGEVIEYTRAAFVKVDNVVLAELAEMFSVFLRGTVDSHFTHVLRNPIVLSGRAQLEPQKLLDQIGQMSEADQHLLAPFVGLVRSNAAAGLADANPAR